MAGSHRSWADWEKQAAKACLYCGKPVLNRDASGSRFDHATQTASVWHIECGPVVRVVWERGVRGPELP